MVNKSWFQILLYLLLSLRHARRIVKNESNRQSVLGRTHNKVIFVLKRLVLSIRVKF